MDEFSVTIMNFKPNIVLAAETWLHTNDDESLFDIDGYTAMHFKHDFKIGGGISIWIDNLISFSINNCHLSNDFNKLNCHCEQIYFPNFNVIFIAVYFPPSAVAEFKGQIIDMMYLFCEKCLFDFPKGNLVIAGDFNKLPMDSMISSFNLYCCVNTPTHCDAILDNIFMDKNYATCYNKPEVGPPIAQSDHNTIIIYPLVNYNISKRKFNRYNMVHDLHSDNVNAFMKSLINADFSSVYNSNTVNEKVDNFYKIFLNCILIIPCHKVKVNNCDKPWITPIVKSIINQHWKAFYQHNYSIYNALKINVKMEIVKSKLIWLNKANNRNKHSFIWDYLRQYTQSGSQDYSDIFGMSKLELVNCLTNQFSDNLNNTNFTANDFVIDYSNKLDVMDWNFVITENMVNNAFHHINLGKSSGTDLIYPKILKVAANWIIGSLVEIYNSSLHQFTFPDM